jgi:hypothetical protein
VEVLGNNTTGFSRALTKKFRFALANWAEAEEAILLTLADAALGAQTVLHLKVEAI